MFIRRLSCAHAWNWCPHQFPKPRLELHQPVSQAVRTAKLTECIKTTCRRQPSPAFLPWHVLLISCLAEALERRTTVFPLFASNSEVFRGVQKIKDATFLISLTCYKGLCKNAALHSVGSFSFLYKWAQARKSLPRFREFYIGHMQRKPLAFFFPVRTNIQSVAWTEIIKGFQSVNQALRNTKDKYTAILILRDSEKNACVHFAFTNASLSFEQKDMIADEIQSAKEGSNSKVKNLEKLAAKEICCKYLDRKAGHLLEEVAVDFASAICLCLRKKNLNIAEVIF